MKLSIIIVNYNVRYFLEQALLSVRRATEGMAAEVFVVDNNSKDDSVAMVREKFPEVHLIANKHNPGFSTANNQAIKLSKGEYVLLLNPDTVVEEETFKKCCDFMDAHPDAGGLGAKMIDGSGNFLPESKRGFPSPWVAFCKTFGLSRFFPKSKRFNYYHLGYLSENGNHEVDVLAGAFMLMRKSVLDKIGLLDETFFMYGEDIDLSYRIIKGGYKNYYFSDTQIIHYKGESTKKGSLNYVKVFYNAMIIFAKKHFVGQKAAGFILMLQMAIYFRAFLTLVANFLKKAWFPVIDAALLVGGLAVIKNVWATNYYGNPDYYADSFYYFNVPLYVLVWVSSIFFSGGYDDSSKVRRVTRGMVIGTVLIAAVYGFLPLDLRPSRAIILFGTVWGIFTLSMWRTLVHFFQYGNLNVGKSPAQNLTIIGEKKEGERVLNLLNKAHVASNFMGFVSPGKGADKAVFLGDLSELKKLVNIYKIEEIIFCAADLTNTEIMAWMVRLGNKIEYKIVSENSNSIIGSSSKNTTGTLYTIDIQYDIATTMAKRNKRVLDFVGSLFLWIGSPVFFLFMKNKAGFFKNIGQVLLGKKTLVGYANGEDNQRILPKIKTGVLSPKDGVGEPKIDIETARRLDFFYAKDYAVRDDVEILFKAFRALGR
jgi:GT2 family glycosyltransferase